MGPKSFSIIRVPASTLEAAQAIIGRVVSVGIPRDHMNITPHEDGSFHVAVHVREGDRRRVVSAAAEDGPEDVTSPGPGKGRPENSEGMGFGAVLLRGLAAGAAGVAAMTVAEKLEQAITGRPNSYVPGHTLERLLGLPRGPDSKALNWAMHWGQGILLGAARAVMAERGIRGPVASFLFLNLRLLNDQALENATGVGAPPWTWPIDEQVTDLLHKAIYAYAAGEAADRLVQPRTRSERRHSGHYYEDARTPREADSR